MFDRLSCFHDEVPRTGPLNMALDEQMLEFAAGRQTPVLRTYRWSQPWVSLGYFDRSATVQIRFPNRPLVRRWTGGGAVDHRADFTFSVALPAQHPLARQPAAQRYREIHDCVASALQRCGIPSQPAGRVVAPVRGNSPPPCFESPTCGDLLSGGEKIVGGAQRRSRLGVLHQGSIQWPGSPVDRSAVNDALGLAFAGEQFVLSPDLELMSAAHGLAESKYAADEWLYAR